MSEVSEELVGDAGDDIDMEIMDDKDQSMKSSDGNKKTSQEKTKAISPKQKAINKNSSTTKSQPVGNDLLQALMGDTTVKSNFQSKNKGTAPKQQSKKPPNKGTSLKGKEDLNLESVNSKQSVESNSGIQHPLVDVKVKGEPNIHHEQFDSSLVKAILTSSIQSGGNKSSVGKDKNIAIKTNDNTLFLKEKSESQKEEKMVRQSLSKNQAQVEGSGSKDGRNSNIQSKTVVKEKDEKYVDRSSKPESTRKEIAKGGVPGTNLSSGDVSGSSKNRKSLQVQSEISKERGEKKERSEEKNSSTEDRKRMGGPNIESFPSEKKYSKIIPTTTNTRTSQVDIKKEEKPSPMLSNEDFRNIDLQMVDLMISSVITRTSTSQNSSDTQFKVKVSPLEISDLAEESVQTLIQSFPKISCIFKKQIGKFKKKKGYAEISFTRAPDLKDFMRAFMGVKLIEKKIDISINVWLTGHQTPKSMSFQYTSENNQRLIKLMNSSGQDPLKRTSESQGESVKFDLAPTNVPVIVLQVLFPFCTFVRVLKQNQRTQTEKSLNGPVFVHYVNGMWSAAVMDCCSNFIIDGCAMTWQDQSRHQTVSYKGRNKNDQEQSVKDTGSYREKGSFVVPASRSRVEIEKSSENDVSSADKRSDFEEDDAISNMTRDVCVGMLESLDKLKQLDANNPNIDKILKMREQLDKLQKSLATPKELKKRETEMQENPWEVSHNDTDDRKDLSKSSLKESDKNFYSSSSQQMPQNRNRQDTHRDNVCSRNPNQAKEITGESKWQERKNSGFERGGSKRGMRRGDRESDRRNEMEEERRKREEEISRQEEEARKEAERRKLIQKIEEARQRDQKKAEERAQIHSVLDWESNIDRKREYPFPHRAQGDKRPALEAHLPTASSIKRDHSNERGNNRTSKRSFGESQTEHDDGIDQRLAAFERELTEKGVIQPHSSPSKLKRSGDKESEPVLPFDHAPPVLREDEYNNILAGGQHHLLPPDFRVRIQFGLNRQCPVKGCPATKYFRDFNSFMDHWSMFHVMESTMRFCQKCVAYFVKPEELEIHLVKQHWVSPNEANFMVHQARVKVIRNPSFRDPTPYLPPSL